jgi:cytochrome oxidase Cu insertion factor (SCO1/SenC/PrrC family)
VALNPWIRLGVVIIVGLALTFVVVVGAGLWALKSRATPDVAVGEPLPPIELASLDGEPIALEGYEGQVVVLDFWATW